MDNVESGLHEGILYMNEGSKALLVIPSHLAHGLVGDMNKIPPKSTIVYDIELLELK
jgi:FKBP-type peptidyl-prolyl cis-trans isomerase FkpA